MANKKKSNKPSALLQKALDLFGPKGENWIQGEENGTLEAGFIIKGERVESSDVANDYSVEIERALTDGDVKEVARLAEELKSLVYAPETETYCSIGAVREINTLNENKAAIYLAKAIDAKRLANYMAEIGVVDKYEWASLEKEEAEQIIVGFNDASKRKFPEIKKAFQKAIKLAKKDGN